MFRGEPVFSLIVAAGRSTRMQGQDKIFAPLADVPLLARTVEAFLHTPWVDLIVVMLPRERLQDGRQLGVERGWSQKVRFFSGGARRQDSVRLGLEQFHQESWVLIHDGARPLVTTALVLRGLEAAASVGAAVPGMPVADTIKAVSSTEMVEQTLPRARLRAVQTPQVFRLSLIKAAHEHFSEADRTFTDDAAMLEALGNPVVVFPGDRNNIKVTTQEDLLQVRQLWHTREAEDG